MLQTESKIIENTRENKRED